MRLNALLSQLQNLNAALKRIDRLVTGEDKDTTYYRVVDLKHSSPAEIALQAVPIEEENNFTPQIASGFFEAWDGINNKGEVPSFLDTKTIEAFEKLVAPLGKDFESATLIADDYNVELTNTSKQVLQDTLASETSSYGTVEGKLEAINLHNNANNFRIYPLVGPDVITCRFKRGLREIAKSSLDSYVSVTGLLYYKSRDSFPYKIDVDDMEIYPPAEKLPHLADLRGVAPNATGDASSAGFVERLRDAWQ